MEMARFPCERAHRHRSTMTSHRPFAAVILAAGKGTRMKSDVHKVLHPIAGRAMLDHLMGVLEGLGPARKIVVVGSGREQVQGLVEARGGEIVVQEQQLGRSEERRVGKECRS